MSLTASASLTLCVQSRDHRAASLSVLRSIPMGLCSCSLPASAAACTADRALLRAVSAAMLSASALCEPAVPPQHMLTFCVHNDAISQVTLCQ